MDLYVTHGLLANWSVVITAHWIDAKFRFHDSLLAFHPLEGAHTGENLAKYVIDILVDFDLCEKLFCITNDNASNNNTMISKLFDEIYIRTSVQHDEQNQHISCLAHVINLVVGAFLKNLMVLADGEEKGDDETMHYRIHDGREKDFALTMLKIREISKVQCPVTYKSTFLNLRNRFVRDVFPQG